MIFVMAMNCVLFQIWAEYLNIKESFGFKELILILSQYKLCSFYFSFPLFLPFTHVTKPHFLCLQRK
jgi:hypothetical protein